MAIQCLYKLEKKTSVMLCVQNCILVVCWKLQVHSVGVFSQSDQNCILVVCWKLQVLSVGVFSQSEFIVYSKLQVVSVGAVRSKLHFNFQKL